MNLIASVDNNWGIGYKGRLLCRIPEDMRWFKEHTTGKVVVMGRATLESLPGSRPLAERVNIVISADANFFAPGWYWNSSIPMISMLLAVPQSMR